MKRVDPHTEARPMTADPTPTTIQDEDIVDLWTDWPSQPGASTDTAVDMAAWQDV
jgi:hypothetical protein